MAETEPDSDPVPTATALASTQDAGGSVEPSSEPDPLVGSTLDRYRVEARLGAGGMGVVYAAYDPALDRRIALKVLPVIEEHRRGHLESRLRREAQALARLAHPNVVAVHDVGVAEHSVFLAMQLVDGVTADVWLDAAARTPREIVDMLVAVGRGLAAAHDAGIVHRDVKPSNVMIDAKGRVFVGDFGLARSGDDAEAPDTAGGSLLDENLTRAGAVMGTPPYMAPEQLRGEPATARSDQFGFCVMAWRALYGKHPFVAGRWDVTEAREAMARDAVREPPRRSGVTTRSTRALRRGLRHDPAARWPTMAALTTEIAPRSRAWIAWSAASAVGIIGAVAVTSQVTPASKPAPCDDGHARLVGIWDPARAAELRASFGRVHPGWGEQVAAHVTTRLDAYAESWKSARVEACEATRIRGAQTPTMFDLRIYCLDRRLVELDARVDALLDKPDGTTLARAQSSIGEQPTVASCADITALSATPPPDDPKLRDKIEVLSRRLEDQVANISLGRVKLALEPLRVLAKDVREIKFPSLEAATLLHLGWTEVNAGDRARGRADLEAALKAAGAGHDDIALAKISLRLLFLTAVIDPKPEADTYQLQAETMVARLDGRHDLAARLLDYTAIRRAIARKFDEAIVLGEKARERWHLAKDPIESVDALQNLATFHQDAGHPAEAVKLYREVIAKYTQAVGDRHPTIAKALWNLGTLQFETDDREAIATLTKARAMFVETEGEQTADVLYVDDAFARAYLAFGELDKAEVASRRAVATGEIVLGKDNSELANRLESLAGILNERGGHVDEALAVATRALRIAEPDKDEAQIGAILITQGIALVAANRPRDALESTTRSLALIEKTRPDAKPLVGMARFVRAEAMWMLGQRGQAVEAARQARAEVATGDARTKVDLGHIDTWLATHKL